MLNYRTCFKKKYCTFSNIWPIILSEVQYSTKAILVKVTNLGQSVGTKETFSEQFWKCILEWCSSAGKWPHLSLFTLKLKLLSYSCSPLAFPRSYCSCLLFSLFTSTYIKRKFCKYSPSLGIFHSIFMFTVPSSVWDCKKLPPRSSLL